MRERPVTSPAPTPAAFINAQSAITGLRGPGPALDPAQRRRPRLAPPGAHRPARTGAWAASWVACCWAKPCIEPNPRDSRFSDPDLEPQPALPAQPAGLSELAEADHALDRRQRPERR